MEYDFRPQWRPWFFQMRQIPACARCGNQDRQTFCFAASKQCFKCHHVGHYARMCVFRSNQDIQKYKDIPQTKIKSKSQKDRDSRRLQEYLDSKSLTRSLPFANLRDSAFKSCLNSTSILKCELTCVKHKLSLEQKKCESQTNEIQNLREQLLHLQSVSVGNEKLRADVLRSQDNQKRQSVTVDNCQNHVKRINDLELYLQRKIDFIFDIQQKYEETATEKRQFFNENSILHFKVDEYYKQIGELNVKLKESESEKEQLRSTLNQRTVYQNQSRAFHNLDIFVKSIRNLQREKKSGKWTKFDYETFRTFCKNFCKITVFVIFAIFH
ncbi:unnamed protein product [Mytilus coruscus]|uniref:CCHC-type domain-containing protein n=1 Tax=Mytilus coruscus TaxID=42192 RepID=A0A6J8EM77_MYTCO|nr:unnamed protein product [Mytilus coruscus]